MKVAVLGLGEAESIFANDLTAMEDTVSGDDQFINRIFQGNCQTKKH
jgi:hypothetical protein